MSNLQKFKNTDTYLTTNANGMTVINKPAQQLLRMHTYLVLES